MVDTRDESTLPGCPGYYLVEFASGDEIGWYGHTQLDAALRASTWRDKELRKTKRRTPREEREQGLPHDAVKRSLLGLAREVSGW